MTGQVNVSVQTGDFDPAGLQRALLEAGPGAGAVASFTGLVRGREGDGRLEWMELEHYPGMTEASLEQIATEALERWSLGAVSVVHRVGRLLPGDHIVWVGTCSRHRQDAFAACEFIMDYLKTRAPLWKKENWGDGQRWVEARGSDELRADRWRTSQKGSRD